MKRHIAAVVLTSLMAVAGGASFAQGQTLAQRAAEPMQLRGFVITLALGDMQAGPSGTFTPAATKALADLKDFLPYKKYQLLDTAWIIGLPGPHLSLNGADGQKLSFAMAAQMLTLSRVGVRLFRLWDTTGSERPLLIDSSFNIEIGETVVVGTSKLDGTRALVLLVTAAAR